MNEYDDLDLDLDDDLDLDLDDDDDLLGPDEDDLIGPEGFSGSSLHEYGEDDEDDEDDDFGAIVALPWINRLGRKNRYAVAASRYVRRRQRASVARAKGNESKHARNRSLAQQSYARMQRLWSKMKPQARAVAQSPEQVMAYVNQMLGTGGAARTAARVPPLPARQAAQVRQAASQTNYARRRQAAMPAPRPVRPPPPARRPAGPPRRPAGPPRRFAYGQEEGKFTDAASQIAKDHTVATAATVLGIFAAGVLLSDSIMDAVDGFRY
jgi:hypothetical protein